MTHRSAGWALGAVRIGLLVAAQWVGACAPKTATLVRPPRTTPVRCADPASGSWEGEAFLPAFDQWTRLRLEVRRDPADPTRITGEIVSRYWSANTAGTDPPECSLGSYDRSVRMAAGGSLQGQRFVFAGVSWRAERAACGGAAAPGSYALDRLIGTLDPNGVLLRAVDSDGDRAVEAGFVFWRVACGAEERPERGASSLSLLPRASPAVGAVVTRDGSSEGCQPGASLPSAGARYPWASARLARSWTAFQPTLRQNASK